MNEKEYDLLMEDLCGRLPYGVKANVSEWDEEKQEEVNIPRRVHSIDTDGYLVFESNGYGLNYYWIENCALLLRSLSSMTESERKEFDDFCVTDEDVWMGNHKVGFPKQVRIMSKCVDWLNRKMFDYRGLILKGLAIEAPEGMYNI